MKISKISSTIAPTPAGVKKRGEFVARKSTKTSRPIDPVFSGENRQMARNARELRFPLGKFRRLVNMLHRTMLAWKRSDTQKSRMQHERHIGTVLSTIAETVSVLDALTVGIPDLIFIQGNVVHKDDVTRTIAEIRHIHKYEHKNVIEMGLEETYDVPLSVFELGDEFGLVRRLSPFNRSLYMALHAWTEKHTSTRVRRHLAGQPLLNGKITIGKRMTPTTVRAKRSRT